MKLEGNMNVREKNCMRLSALELIRAIIGLRKQLAGTEASSDEIDAAILKLECSSGDVSFLVEVTANVTQLLSAVIFDALNKGPRLGSHQAIKAAMMDLAESEARLAWQLEAHLGLHEPVSRDEWPLKRDRAAE